jgi:hypothetical protein
VCPEFEFQLQMAVCLEHKYDLGKVTFGTFYLLILDYDLKGKLVAVS